MARKKNKRQAARRPEQPAESRGTEAVTIAWTVTLTTLLFCHLSAIGAHYYVSLVPEAKKMALLSEMLLLSGAVVGCLSLILLPFVQRLRRVPPPRGLVVFGVCLAVAPILVLVLRNVR